MLTHKIRALAVTGITTLAAALLTLSATGASTATTTATSASHSAASATASAPRLVTAPRAAETPSGCVTEQFGIWDENTHEACVLDEQVLLNDFRHKRVPGPNQILTTDGYYGPHTYSDVRAFQKAWGDRVDGVTGPQTWKTLCAVATANKFQGLYWINAGCRSELPL